LLDQVLLLAMKTHWSRADILQLSASEFGFYIERITELGNNGS